MTQLNLIISEPTALTLKEQELQYQRDGQLQTIQLDTISSIILQNPNITLSHELIQACYLSNTLIMTSNPPYLHPNGLLTPLLKHSDEKQAINLQVKATTPFKKRTWQRIVKVKLANQCKVLAWKDLSAHYIKELEPKITSGDTNNIEPQASKYYFSQLYNNEDFEKHEIIRTGINYGHQVLRSMLIQQLTFYGLHPALGFYHNNEHKAFNLADDFIAALSPIIDSWWLQKISKSQHTQLTDDDRQYLNDILESIVKFERKSYPLQAACGKMITSLLRALKSKDPHQIKFPTPLLPKSR